MPTSFDFRAAVRQAVAGSRSITDADAASVADAVIDRLVQPDALAAMAELVHDMIVGPIHLNGFAAAEELEELLGSRDHAVLITAGVAAALAPPDEVLPADEVLGAQVAALEYKDWRFELVRLQARRAVKVTAVLTDAYHPEKPWTATRTVPIRRTAAEAALQGVLSIEEHEARERLRSRGRTVLSPHAPVAPPSAEVPAPAPST